MSYYYYIFLFRSGFLDYQLHSVENAYLKSLLKTAIQVGLPYGYSFAHRYWTRCCLFSMIVNQMCIGMKDQE